jgi:hypothetical protein
MLNLPIIVDILLSLTTIPNDTQFIGEHGELQQQTNNKNTKLFDP